MGNFCLFLGMFLVSVVSGNTAEQVSGFTGGSVVLPCSCENRDTSEGFFWQMIHTQKPLKVFPLEGQDESYGKQFEGRVEHFDSDISNNCSILLKNIIGGDHGIYRCYYRTIENLQYWDVDLNVSDPPMARKRSSETQTTPTSTKNPQTEKPDWKMLWMVAILVLGL